MVKKADVDKRADTEDDNHYSNVQLTFLVI